MRRKAHKKRSANRGRSRSEGRRVALPKNLKQYLRLPEGDQDLWNRTMHVVSKMRSEHLSLTKAAREFGLDRQTVLRLAKSALRKKSNGQYAARATDKLLRVLVIPTPEGLSEIALRNSSQASLVGEYWAAVQRYLQTGDDNGLRRFEGKRIRAANRKVIRLVTDVKELDRLGNAGVLSFESLYARAS